MEKETFVAVRHNSDGDLIAFKSNTGKEYDYETAKELCAKGLLMPKPLKEKVAELIFVALSTVTKTITYRTYQPFKQIIFHKKIHPVFNTW